MNIGLYFGSYNPIHVGHLIIANYLVDQENLDQLWFVVSPHNPHKTKSTLLADHHRLNIVKEAIDANPKLKACDIEFSLEQPNYTSKTLAVLQEQYPDYTFSLIMGEDNLRTFHKWYNYEYILERFAIYVYPRAYTIQELKTESSEDNKLKNHPSIHFCEGAPVMNISSSYVRALIKKGGDVSYLLTPEVKKYVEEMNFYK